jgi:glucose-1-phosphate cytidylyltransferase
MDSLPVDTSTMKTRDLSDIPVVILCGGKATRMRESGELRPKPMVEIGGRPILWHIMKIYSCYGFRRFVLPLGFAGDQIEAYFSKGRHREDWEVRCISTGVNTLKGGRIKRVERYLDAGTFHLTYGDGVADINLTELHTFHSQHGSLATVTAVRPPSRFGELILQGQRVTHFAEKPQMSSGTINGGFFVFQREFLDALSPAADCDLEFGALQRLAGEGRLIAYRHPGFWQCMDTPRERDFLNTLWKQGAPWKIWRDKNAHETKKLVLET